MKSKPIAHAVLILLCLSLPLATVAALPAAVEGHPLPTLAPMLQRAMPAVVNIATEGRVAVRNPLLDDPFFQRFFGLPQQRRERRTQGLGSGVIIDAQRGYILTNDHVIEKADLITVTLQDGRQFEATLIGTDPETDVAVIQIKGEKLTALPVADSEKLQVGDFAVAIGNPFGLGQTVTSGIISALGRSGLGIESYEDFIQTDASINPGNSGGALVNLNGELIGINTAILGPSGGNIGIGFAIPINLAHDIMDQLVEYGEVRRGRLGVAVQDLTPELAKVFGLEQQQGAVIAQITPASPAEHAGLKVGDVIVEINGRAVRSGSDIRNVVGLLRIGSRLNMGVIRKGQRHSITAVIAESQSRKIDGKQLSRYLNGATLGEIGEDSRYYGEIEGVLVLDVTPRSPAARAGLREGDIILAANDQPAADLEALQQAVPNKNQGLSLNVLRGNSQFFILLR